MSAPFCSRLQRHRHMYFLPKLKDILHTHKFEDAYGDAAEHRKAKNMAGKTKHLMPFEERVCRMARQWQTKDALGVRRELYYVDSSTKLYERTQKQALLII
jgi:hypothetical protein